jgi:hypothetical protein
MKNGMAIAKTSQAITRVCMDRVSKTLALTPILSRCVRSELLERTDPQTQEKSLGIAPLPFFPGL